MDRNNGPFAPGPQSSSQINGYADAICLTIIVYGLMLTLPLEVSLIWRSKWSLTKALYLYSRYFPVCVFSFYLVYDVPSGPLAAIAGKSGLSPKLSDWLLNANLVVVEALFSLRTWAIWNRKRTVGILLLSLFLALWISTLVLLVLFTVGKLNSKTFERINFAMLTGFYFCTSALMCGRAYQSCVIYYLFLLILSAFSLIFSIVHKSELGQFLPRLLQLLFTIMVTRMTLNLREAGTRTIRAVDTTNTEFLHVTVSNRTHRRHLST